MSRWLTCPKVELHCHLLGIIDPPLLRSIERRGGRVLVPPEALERLHPVRDLDSFQRWVDLLKPYQKAPPEIMRPILAAHVEGLIAQHVRYTEIMLSPAMFPKETRDLLNAFHRWREWAFAMEQGRIQIEFILVVPRTLGTEALTRDTENFIALKREGLIAGVALVGIEDGTSIAPFRTAIARWRDAGLGLEIHAGEHGGPESVRDALENGPPDRLGHAVAAFRDPGLTDRLRSAGIHIEFCPTSNLRTGAVPSIDQHPLGLAREMGMSFSLNTDDPGAFGCSLTGEYARAAEAFGFGSEEFQAIFRDSLAARFERRLRYPLDWVKGSQGDLTR